MSSKNREPLKQDEDNRALWERPVIRRLATKDAEGTGGCLSEGESCSAGTGMHSGKNA
jgi:hypothetical protein